MLPRAEFLCVAGAVSAAAAFANPRDAEADTLDPSTIAHAGATPVFVRMDETGGQPGGIFSPQLAISDDLKSKMLGGEETPIASTAAKMSIEPKYFSPSASRFKDGKDLALLQLGLLQESALTEFDPVDDQKLSWTNLWSLISGKGQQIKPGPLSYVGATRPFANLPFTGGSASITCSFLWGNTNDNTAATVKKIFDSISGVASSAAFVALFTLPAVDVALAGNIQKLVLGLLDLGKHPYFEYEFGQGTVQVIYHKSSIGSAGIGDLVLPKGRSYWIAIKPDDSVAFMQAAGAISKRGHRISFDPLTGKPVILDVSAAQTNETDLNNFTLVTFQIDVTSA